MVQKKKSLFDKLIQILTHSVDKSPNNLHNYDVILAGDSLSFPMTRNLTKITHGHKMIYYDAPQGIIQAGALRIPYESRAVKEGKYTFLYSELLDPSVGMNSAVRIQKILPEESAVQLSNGNKIEYKAMLFSSGFQANPEAIPGLIEGINISGGRVYSTLPKMTNPLFYSYISLFEHGQAFIYIPEFPFQNQVEQLNFLYALATWEMNEQLGISSPLRHLTIINANDRLAAKCDVLDEFLRTRLASHPKVDVLFNTKLTKIDNKNSTITLQAKDGQTKELEFRRLYCHVPVNPDPLLVDSGLIAPGKKTVEVDPKTLAHKKHENIFLYGENLDIPVEPSIEATMIEATVARHNALEYIEGRKTTAEYKGQTRIPIFTGVSQVAVYTSDWIKGPHVKEGGLYERWMYRQTVNGYAKNVRNAYMSKRATPTSKRYAKFPKGEQVRVVAPSEHH